MASGAEIVAEARRWIGTPYLHQGRSKYGIDCIGLVFCVCDALGFLPEGMQQPTNYRRKPAEGLLITGVQRLGFQPLQTVETGAIALVKFPKAKTPSHAMICTGEGTIVHAYERVKHVCEVGYRAHWERWTHSLWRLPGVTS